MRAYIIAISICLALAFAPARAKIYTDEVLSSNLARCILQDADGYIWIATGYGLNRFDGHRVKMYLYSASDTTALPSAGVTALCQDRTGRLWVGTSKGMVSYDKESDSFRRVHFPGFTVTQPNIAAIAEGSDGTLLIGTSGYGFYVIPPGSLDPVRSQLFKETDGQPYASDILVDGNDRLWLGVDNGTVLRFDYNTGALIDTIPSPGGNVRKFVEGSDGSVFILWQHGAARSLDHRLEYLKAPAGTEFTSAAKSGGRVVVGTNHGLLAESADSLVPLSLDLPGNLVSCLYSDRDNALWVGCDQKGVVYVPPKEPMFKLFNAASGLIESFATDHDGAVWVASKESGVRRLAPGASTFARVDSPHEANELACSADGTLWLGSGQKLMRYDNAARRFVEVADFECRDLRVICEGPDGMLYISTFGKGLAVYDPFTGRARQFSMHTDRLKNDWINDIIIHSDGSVWLATAFGMQRYDPRSGEFDDALLPGVVVMALAEMPGGDIAVGTNAGLRLYDKASAQVVPFPGAEPVADVTFRCIIALPGGDLWCSSAMGLWHYDKAKGEFTHYINGNGLRGHDYQIDLGGYWPDGRIAFGTADDLVVFDPHAPAVPGQMPSPRLIGVIVDGKRSPSGKKSFPYGENTFTLEFSTFDYANIENETLQYSINGGPWIDVPDGDNTVTFYNLSAGEYTLLARASSQGAVSEPFEYRFTILPPWYRSAWAYALYLLVVSAIAVAIGITLKKRHRRRVEEDKIELLINATHDIRTPLTMIINPLRQLIRDNDNEQAAARLKTIDANASRILALVNQILDIRRIDSRKMPLRCEAT